VDMLVNGKVRMNMQARMPARACMARTCMPGPYCWHGAVLAQSGALARCADVLAWHSRVVLA